MKLPMKQRLYRFFQVVLVLIISSASAFAIDNSIIENYRSTVVRNNEGKVQKYSVLVAKVAEPKYNSDFSEHFVQRVDEKFYQKGQIYVKTKTKTDSGKGELLQAATALTSALQAIGSTEITAFADAKRVEKNPGLSKYGLDRVYKINIPLDEDPFEICAELMNNPDVEYACPVSIEYSNAKPNDPLQDKQYTLNNMQVFEAWEYSKGSPDIKIAIVDSGTDYEHPDLAANIWTNPNEIPNDGIDNDGNGKIDDVQGWDFVANKSIKSLQSGDIEEDNDPMNRQNTHGTSVAGCASAVTDNAVGIAGVGYNCKLIPVKVGANLQGVIGLFRTYEGITYAADLGAEVINCSFGGGLYSPMHQDVINYAVLEKDAVVVASSGNSSNNNDNFPAYPASYRYVISVGASNKNDNMAFFSNYGYNVTTFAPGDRVFTTDIDGKYTNIDGTSFSSPNVAGVVGLLRAVHPKWGARKFLHQIRSTSDRKSKNGRAYEYYGTTNALKAVTYNSPNSNITLPGISIEKFYLHNNPDITRIQNYNEFTISFELKNLLAPTEKLKVTPFSADGVLEIMDKEVLIPEIAEDGTVTISINAKLSENNPWSEGYAKLVLEYEGENGRYSDYEMVKVPLKVQQEAHTFTSKQRINYEVAYSDACSFNDAWAAMTDNAYRAYALRLNVAKNDIKYFPLKPGIFPTAVANTNNEDAFFAMYSPSMKYCGIIKTYDTGNSFSEVEVYDITKKINAFLFKDDLNGLFIGDPKDGKWGIGISRNRGIKWAAAANPPEAADNYEGMFSNAHELIGDVVYFGTDRGRIHKSSDFGQNWESKTSVFGAVHSMAFIDENLGMVIYYDNEAPIAKFALTGDGGNTWEDVYQFQLKELGERPKDIYADRRGRAFIVVYSDGAIYRTEDFGATWDPIRKRRNGGIASSAFYANADGDVAVFQFGVAAERIYRKAQNAPAPNPTKPVITFNEGKEVSFGSVEVNSSKELTLKLTNVGDGSGKIAGYELKVNKGDNSEFHLTKSPQVELNPGANTEVDIKFTPKTEGDKEAELIVNYGTSKVAIKILASAFVKSSVQESNAFAIAKLMPNPAANSCQLSLGENADKVQEVQIFSADGRMLMKLAPNFSTGTMDINASALPAGHYSILLLGSGIRESVKLVIVK